MRVLRAVLLTTAVALSLFAQSSMNINVHVVEVPVTVVGRDGNPVRGLKASNFVVLDDGQPRTITGFDAIDFTSTQAVSAISPLNAHARRSFLLLFDLGYADPKLLDRGREAATRFVVENVQPRDLVAVGSVDPDKGFRLLTAFTTDRNIVENAIKSPRAYFGADPLQLSDTGAFNDFGDTNVDSGSAKSSNAALADEHLAEIKERVQLHDAEFKRGRIRAEIDSLGTLATVLQAVPGRKQVVLLSGGFDPALIRGRDAAGSSARELADMNRATSGQAYLIDNDARFGHTGSVMVLDKMTELFKRSDVVMNAIDISGVRELDPGRSQRRSAGISNDSLHMLADPTGGTVFENRNDLHADFEKMMHQQEVVYVLAFQATSIKPGKLHNLSVKVVDVPGAKVNSRLAYTEGAPENNAERVLSNAEIVVNDIPQRDIRVAGLAAALPAQKRGAVPLFLEINGSDLLQGATAPVKADVFVYAFDEQGVVRDRLYQEITIDPARNTIKKNGIKYFATLALPPGHYALRSLVTVGERRGFVRTDVVVPMLGDLGVMPPLFRDTPNEWTLLKGAQHESVYPFQLDGEPFVPSATARLHAAQKGEFALFLYNADAADMMMQATTTDSAGVTRPASTSVLRAIKGDGVTKLVFQCDATGLAAGPATLDLQLHKKGSSDVRKASVGLVVE